MAQSAPTEAHCFFFIGIEPRIMRQWSRVFLFMFFSVVVAIKVARKEVQVGTTKAALKHGLAHEKRMPMSNGPR